MVAGFGIVFLPMLTLYPPLGYAQAVKPLPVIKAQHALHLRALVEIESDETGTKRRVGDEWLLEGPTTYLPQPEVVCSSALG